MPAAATESSTFEWRSADSTAVSERRTEELVQAPPDLRVVDLQLQISLCAELAFEPLEEIG
jgi:hypothetical protein